MHVKKRIQVFFVRRTHKSFPTTAFALLSCLRRANSCSGVNAPFLPSFSRLAKASGSRLSAPFTKTAAIQNAEEKTRQSATTYQDCSGFKKRELKCEIIHLSDAFDRRHSSLSMAPRTTGKSPLSALTVLPSCRLLVLQHSATRRKCRGTHLRCHNVGLQLPPPPLKSKARFPSRHIRSTQRNNPPTTTNRVESLHETSTKTPFDEGPHSAHILRGACH